ncbi:Caspase domain-containing protein [Kandleria vitulina]|jgi:hypothetical protein|uniref:Caspase domain-containing protein n=1 Tax=Kandleria vitulina TaxID=1630 RepID=A0A1H2PWM4_9FIRM|nr:caspase family protein [Kandleria vitulina]SDV99261.1 Caspase domain-containing protein [Kandleria vitulina]
MKRIALLIGNDNYQYKNMSLKGAVNDAKELGDALEKLDFSVSVKENLSGNQMGLALADFKNSLDGYNVGLFFFAGHGFQIEGKNYLGCTDASFADAGSAKYTSFELQDAIDALENSKLEIKILIIDACREYFSGNGRGINGGFAPILAPKGTIIAFATSPGQVAKEINGHGVYTSALLKHISTEKISIEDMFKRVRNTVYLETKGQQVTWEHTSLMGNFKFNDKAKWNAKNPYSKYALADNEYEYEKNGVCKELIELAKTINWNYQNKIPGIIRTKKAAFISESRDDLFVLGRNLYQSSHDPYMVSDWFDSLHNELGTFDNRVANDLLSGMAFEIYFDSKGALRERFKTLPHYRTVLKELLDDRYEESLNFIRMQLSEYTQRVMYIPGKEKLSLEIELADSDDDYYVVKRIVLDGVDIMYDEKGVGLYDYEDQYRGNYGTAEELCEVVRTRIAATKRGADIMITNCEDSDKRIFIPVDYQLLMYGNNVDKEDEYGW